jgi:hypothetical protein
MDGNEEMEGKQKRDEKMKEFNKNKMQRVYKIV